MYRILIEGLDLTGKSTLCNNLVSRYSSEFIYKKAFYTVDNPLYWEAVKKTKEGYSEEVIGWLYSAAAQYELDMLKNDTNIFRSDKEIIQDSLFLNRLIGFNGVKDRKLLLEVVKDIISKVEKPERVFYLYTDLNTRIQRFYKRLHEKSVAVSDKLVFEDNSIARKREVIMRNFMISTYNAEVIDTTNVDSEKLTEIVYERIRRRK